VCLRRSVRDNLAILFGLLILLTPTTTESALPSVTSGIPESQQPVTKNAATTQQDRQTLELAKPIEREIAEGETHYYQGTLATRQFARVVFDQRGVNLIITVYRPDGQKLAELDSPNGGQGPEPVSMIGEISGDYRLEVRSLLKESPKGFYVARIEELRA